jgi:hypothetical protein
MRLLAVILLVGLVGDKAHADIDINLETGAVISGYNDVRIPGDTGTEFSLSEELETDPTVFFRMKLRYFFRNRHALEFLFAPLVVEPSGSISRDVVFEGETFPGNTELDATYRFNSYRVKYQYTFYRSEDLDFGLGLAAKIRDAEVKLTGGGKESSKTNVGLVPLLSFRLVWMFHDKADLILEGDALAGPQGRAEDVLAAINYHIRDDLTLKAGYRILEGGADVDEVYNFTLLNYAVVGVVFRI